MPHSTTYLRKGYLKDLVKKYDHNNSKNLADFSRNIGINITTLRAINKGEKVQIKTTIKKIAEYFGIKDCFIENSILTEQEAKDFLESLINKKNNIPNIMKKIEAL
tara:strand:+ start:1091 stop:1408 length:318 start_codon:yes stop_codon:yes gene_type:complete